MINYKIRTTHEQNIMLQELFLKSGFTFMSGAKEVKEPCDFFYFSIIGTLRNNDIKYISISKKTDIYHSGWITNLKFYDGETHFKKAKFREITGDVMEKVNKILKKYHETQTNK